jgi:two-component system alkaline phosphatase synthesis response regulator PhoP
MKRILLVEDEDNIRNLIKMNLEMEAYEVLSLDSGKLVMDYFADQHFDLIILDIMLPDTNGLDICEQIRLTNPNIPIIFVSAKDTSEDRILGLKKGADDYLTKPFNLEELLLRIEKLIARSNAEVKENMQLYHFGKNSINFSSYEATGGSGNFILTKKEAMLLKLLIERENEVVSRQQILRSVWGYDVFPSTRTIDNFILSFRKYFEENPKEPKYFHSIRGIGYKFINQKE